MIVAVLTGRGHLCDVSRKARRTYSRFRPDLRSARPETRSRVTSDFISSQSAHISADSPGESGGDRRKVSANHNRCNS